MPIKSQHYRAIHRRIWRREWDKLSDRERDIVAADAAHESPIYQSFEGRVAKEAERLFNDPAYFLNDPWTFRVHPYEDREMAEFKQAA